MEIDSWIKSATETLAKAGVDTPRLDSIVLAENVLGKDRGWLLAHQKEKITKNDLILLNKFIARRSTHYPLAYITHKAHFYNNQFFVNDHILIPRPESETIIDTLKTLPLNDISTIIDIGTGSGALAISAKLLYPKSEVIAIDIDQDCLRVAKKNALTLKTDIKFLQGNLLQPLSNNLMNDYVLLSNLPYVPDSFPINSSAKLEPKLAIFGGINGLDLYSQLFAQIADLTSKPNHVITESFPNQHPILKSIAERAGYKCLATNDFIQLFSHRH
jgi:release factor glutamine methyltransferase